MEASVVTLAGSGPWQRPQTVPLILCPPAAVVMVSLENGSGHCSPQLPDALVRGVGSGGGPQLWAVPSVGGAVGVISPFSRVSNDEWQSWVQRGSPCQSLPIWRESGVGSPLLWGMLGKTA